MHGTLTGAFAFSWLAWALPALGYRERVRRRPGEGLRFRICRSA
jgi:hypothetical protein